MRKTYDTMILGCGEAGVFAGYELIRRNPGMKVLIVDQGQDIYHRSCPIVAGKVRECIDCKVCHTMCGFGGAGAFSDGKYNFTTAFGGWLTDFMPEQEVMELIDYVDEINTAHGATREVFSTETPAAQALRKKALEFDLHLLQARVKHLGTENNLRILTNLYEDLRRDITFQFNTAVTAIRQAEGGYCLETADGDQYLAKFLIAAPGRSGAEWFAQQCRQLGLPMTNNQIDIGVRVELPALIFDASTDSAASLSVVIAPAAMLLARIVAEAISFAVIFRLTMLSNTCVPLPTISPRYMCRYFSGFVLRSQSAPSKNSLPSHFRGASK